MSASTIDCLRSAPDWGDGRVAVTISQPTAFFSYSREDSEFVLHVAGDLKAAGANVWLDQMDIVPGQRWDDAVERALAGCPRMLVVLSPTSVHSTNVMDEVSFALEEGKTVIPILYRDCVIPFRLRRVQYIDLRHDYDHGLAELLKLLAEQQSTVANPGAAANMQGTPVVPEIVGQEGAAGQVATQGNPGSSETTQAGTSARSRTLSTSTTDAPSPASTIEIAWPMPTPSPLEPAPVTIATLPSSRPVTVYLRSFVSARRCQARRAAASRSMVVPAKKSGFSEP